MNEKIEKRVGENLRHLRERAGITQELLSTKLQVKGCDITRSALAKIEVGQRHIYLDEIVYLKEVLEIEYDELFDMSERPPEPENEDNNEEQP